VRGIRGIVGVAPGTSPRVGGVANEPWSMPTQTTTVAPSALAENVRSLRDRLASTHVGLEGPIERLLNAAIPWLLLAPAQRRPRVIGLWGMTGTGKSSLVHALVDALELEDRTFWLDAGGCASDQWLDQTLNMARTHHNGKPFVVVFDEFQHARTVREGTEQVEPTELRRLWELIDTGRLSLVPHNHWGLSALLDLHDRLRTALFKGVVVRKGRVARGRTVHQQVFDLPGGERTSETSWFVPLTQWEYIRDNRAQLISLVEVGERLEKLDGPGTLAWLAELIAGQSRPSMLDASKALIFVLGNLDALYGYDLTPLPELDPDVLIRRHKTHCATGVQGALLQLFRVEQVARLGSDHVVFPPIGASTLRELALRESQSLAASLGAVAGTVIEVSNGLVERIQNEAAIAILGARPVVEAVHQVLPGLVGQVLLQAGPDAMRKMQLDLHDGHPVAILVGNDTVTRMRLKWPLERGTLPLDQRQLEQQAVHEAGHVLCGVLLNHCTPLQACARTSSERMGGFVAWTLRERVPVRRDVVPHLAQLLGGWVAEKLMFGDGSVSAGSGNDLERASEFALDMVKTQGMGSWCMTHTTHAVANSPGFRFGLMEVEAEAGELMRQAEDLALRTLGSHRELLVQLSDMLVEQGSLGYAELRRLLIDLAPTAFPDLRVEGLSSGLHVA